MNGLFVVIATTLMGWGTPAISFQDEKRDDRKGLEQLGILEKAIMILHWIPLKVF